MILLYNARYCHASSHHGLPAAAAGVVVGKMPANISAIDLPFRISINLPNPSSPPTTSSRCGNAAASAEFNSTIADRSASFLLFTVSVSCNGPTVRRSTTPFATYICRVEGRSDRLYPLGGCHQRLVRGGILLSYLNDAICGRGQLGDPLFARGAVANVLDEHYHALKPLPHELCCLVWMQSCQALEQRVNVFVGVTRRHVILTDHLLTVVQLFAVC